MKIGDIVTITVDQPGGMVSRQPSVLNEVGMITDFDQNICEITTGNPKTTGWWYEANEFRPATSAEIEARLRFVLERRR